jgi:peptidoglycan/LPS O-acetylase OafA/YrhL
VGFYRFLLAWCVVIEHLSGNVHFSYTGMFAVFGFYVLSGYLITRALNEVYDFAFFPFWSNRFLRIYPPYFLLLAFALAFVVGTPSAAEFFPAVWSERPTPLDWLGIVAVFPMGVAPMGWTFRPIPSIWSVGVELLNYALLYAAVARRRNAALVVAIAGVGYHVVSMWRGDDWGARYFPFYAAMLPFAVGALIYFWTRQSRVSLSTTAVLILCAPVLANMVITCFLGAIQSTIVFAILFYSNLGFQGLAVMAMALHKSRRPFIDKFFGDLSYPIFLCHWLVGYLLTIVFFPGQSRGIGQMLLTLVCATAVAYIVCKLQDQLVEPVRAQLRSRASASATPVAGLLH